MRPRLLGVDGNANSGQVDRKNKCIHLKYGDKENSMDTLNFPKDKQASVSLGK